MATEEGLSVVPPDIEPQNGNKSIAEASPPSATAAVETSTALDAERVQNAVAFLSHPKARIRMRIW